MSYGFSETDARRVAKATVEVERTQTELAPGVIAKDTLDVGARMRLLEDLEVGGEAEAAPLTVDEETGEEIPDGGPTQLVRLGNGGVFYAAGTDVTVITTDDGPTAISGEISGYPPVANLPTYAVLEVTGGRPDAPGVLNLKIPGADPNREIWDKRFVFFNGRQVNSKRRLKAQSGSLIQDLTELNYNPVVTQAPAWVRYEEGTSEELPDDLKSALGISSTEPSVGELWAPASNSYGVKRTITYLPVYWYKWDRTPKCVANPAGDTPENVWQGTQTECTPGDDEEVPPDLGEDICWVSNHGWWAWSGFWWGGWNSTWDGSSFTDWDAWPSAWSSIWGAWGSGWWNYRWNGRPPSAADLPDVGENDPIPQPSVGEVTREGLYGYIVWQWGWEVLSVDKANKRVFVWGPGNFTMPTIAELVVVNGEVPCNGGNGGNGSGTAGTA